MTRGRGVVWYEQEVVGHLREDQRGALHFAYDRDWIAGQAFPISVSLPLSNGDAEVEAHGFFAGLLPEGQTRQRICRQRQIDPEDDAGLLLAIGEDCAGALSILSEDYVATPEAPPRRLSRQEITDLVASHGNTMLRLLGGAQRFSLAGAQEKLAVTQDVYGYALPDRSHPSSHILKFETVPWVCFAEFVANDMARRIGLPVVSAAFSRLPSQGALTPYLVIERYDRLRTTDGRLRRLHQEDLIQALQYPGTLKYEQDGGPSLGDVAALLRAHVRQPVRALQLLRDWQIFNYLIGNSDGHGKNLALLYRRGEVVPELAPFYDLVAIEYINRVGASPYARDMAFYIGENRIPERITRSDWERFARALGMPPRAMLNRLRELAERIPAIARETRAAFAAEHGDHEVYERLERSVNARSRWTLGAVFAGR